MLNIGNKKYRNMQEQVAYNFECIQKILEYLDGLSIEDKLVIIQNTSGTFTNDEIAILDGPLAFISNGEKVWMKTGDGDEIVFKAIDIHAEVVGDAYCKIGGSKITVSRISGTYTTEEDSIINTYNKTQIDSIVNALLAGLDGKANLSGANFTGDVTAKTFKQDEPNFEYDFSQAIQSAFNANSALSGATLNISFAKVQQFNHLLVIVASFRIDNTTENSINSGSIAPVLDLSPIADKIYDQYGTPLSQPADANTRICGVVGVLSNQRYGSHNLRASSMYRTQQANNAVISLDFMSMTAGQSAYTDLRFELIV